MCFTAEISAQNQNSEISELGRKYDRLEETSLGLPKSTLKPNITKKSINRFALFFFHLLISITIIGYCKEKTSHCPIPAYLE